MDQVRGVVLTGVYGSGKSSLAAEIAGLLEARGLSCAAIDLDWLYWFHSPGATHRAYRDALMANVAAVIGTYRDAGVERFAMAWAIKDQDELAALRSAAGMPLQVVRLAVPVAEIRRRLAASPESERRHDLQVAETWMTAGVGREIGDIEIDNTGPLRTVAARVVQWSGWE